MTKLTIKQLNQIIDEEFKNFSPQKILEIRNLLEKEDGEKDEKEKKIEKEPKAEKGKTPRKFVEPKKLPATAKNNTRQEKGEQLLKRDKVGIDDETPNISPPIHAEPEEDETKTGGEETKEESPRLKTADEKLSVAFSPFLQKTGNTISWDEDNQELVFSSQEGKIVLKKDLRGQLIIFYGPEKSQKVLLSWIFMRDVCFECYHFSKIIVDNIELYICKSEDTKNVIVLDSISGEMLTSKKFNKKFFNKYAKQIDFQGCLCLFVNGHGRCKFFKFKKKS